MPKFECPHCSQSIDAPDDLAGANADCPTCGKAITVPDIANKKPEETKPPKTKPKKKLPAWLEKKRVVILGLGAGLIVGICFLLISYSKSKPDEESVSEKASTKEATNEIEGDGEEGANEVALKIFNQLDGSQGFHMKLEAEIDDYFNYGFKDEGYLCLSIKDNIGGSGHAYLRKDSKDADRLVGLFKDGKKHKCTVLLAKPKISHDVAQFIIERFYGKGWSEETNAQKEERILLAAAYAKGQSTKTTSDGKTEKMDAYLNEAPDFNKLNRLRNSNVELVYISKIEEDTYYNYSFSNKRDKYVSYEVYDHQNNKAQAYIPRENGVNKKIIERIKSGLETKCMALVSYPHSEKSENNASLFLVLDGIYEWEWSEPEAARLGKMRDFILSQQKIVFGDKRDLLFEKYGQEHLRHALKSSIGNGEVKYDHVADLFSALLISMPNQKMPASIEEQKKWIKSALGKPYRSDYSEFNKGRALVWTYSDILKNKDTDKYSEDVSIAFFASVPMINVSGPHEVGGGGGGINDARGMTYNTYVPLVEKLRLYASIINRK